MLVFSSAEIIADNTSFGKIPGVIARVHCRARWLRHSRLNLLDAVCLWVVHTYHAI